MRFQRPAILAVLLVAVPATAQYHDVLNFMMEEASIIAHVRVTEVEGYTYGEYGVQEWTALCDLVSVIKGSPSDDDDIRIKFTRFDIMGTTEPALLEVDGEYIVFLGESYGSIRMPSDDELHSSYPLIDRWLGALPYELYLERHLQYYQ